MAKIPGKVSARIAAGIKRFQPVIEAAKTRDVNESDTALIVTDVLAEVMGYAKYTEITSEYMIRSTYCDLAVALEGRLAVLIEVKAIGAELKENHIRQAVDYAANQGCDWVALTNGVEWQVYKVSFGRPIEHELIVGFNFLELNPRKQDDVRLVWLLSKEGWQKSRLNEFADQRQALSRFTLAAVLLADPCLKVVRRELRRLSPDVRFNLEQIREGVAQEVLKRDVQEGEHADAARRRVERMARRPTRPSVTVQPTPDS